MARRLETAFELFDLGVELLQAKLQREHPEWTEDEVRAGVGRWLRTRPGAEWGDGLGRLGHLPAGIEACR